MPRIMNISQKKDRLFSQMELFSREVIPYFRRSL